MHRSISSWLLGGVLVLGALAGGCAAPAVGDPCTPESVPEGGFVPTEAYLETSSVQCETRVCMVYKLEGDPRPGCTTGCPTDSEIRDRVYCTCRCRAPGASNAKLCDCPDGYVCEDVLSLGGPGVQGGYCVKSNTVSST